MLATKRSFVRMVSHEIRTPLNVVLTGLTVMEKELAKHNNEAALLDIVQDARLSCDSAIDLLNDLLSYEKLEAGVMTLEKSEVSVMALLREAVGPFQIQVSNHCILVSLYVTLYFLSI